MLKPRELLLGDIPRWQRLAFRVPLAATLLAGATVGVAEGYQAVESDKGCTVTEVPRSGDAIVAALAARSALELDHSDVQLQDALTTGAQSGVGAHVDVGDSIETCVTYNPLRFGNQWEATVREVPEATS